MHLDIDADGAVLRHRDQAVAAGMGEIELKSLRGFGEKGFPGIGCIEFEVGGIDTQLKGKNTPNGAMCFQRASAFIWPLETTGAGALTCRKKAYIAAAAIQIHCPDLQVLPPNHVTAECSLFKLPSEEGACVLGSVLINRA